MFSLLICYENILLFSTEEWASRRGVDVISATILSISLNAASRFCTVLVISSGKSLEATQSMVVAGQLVEYKNNNVLRKKGNQTTRE